jgi:hypothetical protein
MEISDKIENKEIIAFPRKVHSGEIKNLMKYLAKELPAHVDYEISENISDHYRPKEKKLEEYTGILYKLEGCIYGIDKKEHSGFKCKINETICRAESFEFSDSNRTLDSSDEKVKELWEDIRNATNKYFLENPKESA